MFSGGVAVEKMNCVVWLGCCVVGLVFFFVLLLLMLVGLGFK